MHLCVVCGFNSQGLGTWTDFIVVYIRWPHSHNVNKGWMLNPAECFKLMPPVWLNQGSVGLVWGYLMGFKVPDCHRISDSCNMSFQYRASDACWYMSQDRYNWIPYQDLSFHYSWCWTRFLTNFRNWNENWKGFVENPSNWVMYPKKYTQCHAC